MGYGLTEADLARALGGHAFGNGRQMRARGLVRSVEASGDGSSIAASVSSAQSDGRRRQPYSQTISLSWRGERLAVKGYCTCPVGLNCKHVAAALIQLAGRSGGHAIAGSGGYPIVKPADRFAAQSASQMPASHAGGPLALPVSLSASRFDCWLDRVAAAAGRSEPAEAGPTGSPRVLLYVLNPKYLSRGDGAACFIRPVSARRVRDGSFTDAKPYAADHGGRIRENRPRYVGDRDHAILDDLDWLRRMGAVRDDQDTPLPASVAGRLVFDALLATGRLLHGDVDGPVVRAGQPAEAVAVWRKAENHRQQLWFEPQPVVAAATGEITTPRFDLLLPLSPPYYLDLDAGRAGPVVCDLTPELALEVVRAPLISASEATQVAAALGAATTGSTGTTALRDRRSSPRAVLPLPETASEVEVREVVPTPVLDLSLALVRVAPRYRYGVSDPRHLEPFKLPVAKLSYDYDGRVVPGHGTHPPSLEHMDGDKLVVMRRQPAREQAASQLLAEHGLSRLAACEFLQPTEPDSGELFQPLSAVASVIDQMAAIDDPRRSIAFSADVLPELAAAGWRITFAADYPYQIAEGAADWWADVGEGSGIDWFSFELGINFEGHRINLVPQLASLIADLPDDVLALCAEPAGEALLTNMLAGLKLYHTLPDGRLLPLPGERLGPALIGLMGLIGPRHEAMQDGELRLHRAETPALAAFAARSGAEVAWAASTERLVALGRNLVAGRAPEPVAPPDTFTATLRPYQSDGLAWLDFLRSSGFGGVLADDMGLGKTVQALAFLAREKAEGRLDKPALIVAPTSVLPNWQAEAQRFAPELSVLALRGPDRHQQFGQIPAHDLILTTYPLLARDQETLLALDFHVAILDEAQAIKNPKAINAQIAHRIKARHRLALTGTPLENNLGEVWSLFEYLAPGLLGDAATFRRVFRTPIEKHGDPAAQAFLSRRLKPFMLRRTKEEVATELPPKTIITERVRLDGSQRDLYETVRALMAKKVRDEIAKKGLAKSHIIFLDALLKLRQVCCDPRLLKMPQAKRVKESAKLERLMEMVPELVGEGRRILLFSQFTSMLALIETELDALKIPYVKLTGDTDDRAEPVRRFQTGEVPLFLLSLKAGGTGLNLTAADTVIHYDPWWNPAVENQATDRAYRIGQHKPVFVYKLIVEEGIEEAIELLKARKAALADALFAGGSKAPMALTEADISALFAPLASTAPKTKRAA